MDSGTTLSIADVAEQLQLSPTTLRKWLKEYEEVSRAELPRDESGAVVVPLEVIETIREASSLLAEKSAGSRELALKIVVPRMEVKMRDALGEALDGALARYDEQVARIVRSAIREAAAGAFTETTKLMESRLQSVEDRVKKRGAAQVDAQLAPALEKANDLLSGMERVKRDVDAQRGLLDEHAARFRDRLEIANETLAANGQLAQGWTRELARASTPFLHWRLVAFAGAASGLLTGMLIGVAINDLMPMHWIQWVSAGVLAIAPGVAMVVVDRALPRQR